MSRRKTIPSYLHHKPSGQAFCRVRRADGSYQQIYLGKYDSEESRMAYARAIAGHVPGQSFSKQSTELAPTAGPDVARIVELFMEHAKLWYRRPDRTLTNEVAEFQFSARPLLYLFSELPAAEFRASHLRRVQAMMIRGYNHREHGEQGPLSRKVINQRIGRIKRIWKWAAEHEFIPETAYAALALVRGLQANRTEARETEPVKPVAWEVVEATLPHLNPVVRAMVLLQWHTGCRPGEACSIQASEIDRSGPVWLYRPGYHKLAHRNKSRVIAIGQQGQAVLTPFLGRDGFLFSPALAAEQVRAAQAATRRTKRFPFEDRRQKRRKRTKPQRKPGERYTTAVLDRAIERAAVRAGVEPWHPNQLRHAFATRVRAVGGLEAAQVALGHTTADITQIYAERNETLAVEVARKIG